VFAIGILVFAVFGLLAFGASVAAAAIGPDAPPGMTLPWIIGVPLIGVWGVWFGLPGRAERVSQPRGRGWFARGLAAAATGVIVTRDVLLRPRAHTVPLLGTVAYWIFDVLSLWAAMRAVGAELPLLGVAMGYAIGYVAMLFPLPTGGYGAIDAATTFALTAGVHSPLAASSVVNLAQLGVGYYDDPAGVGDVNLCVGAVDFLGHYHFTGKPCHLWELCKFVHISFRFRLVP
jgi:uncharacterized membrane protein YbhN (UPF0104 family)